MRALSQQHLIEQWLWEVDLWQILRDHERLAHMPIEDTQFSRTFIKKSFAEEGSQF